MQPKKENLFFLFLLLPSSILSSYLLPFHAQPSMSLCGCCSSRRLSIYSTPDWRQSQPPVPHAFPSSLFHPRSTTHATLPKGCQQPTAAAAAAIAADVVAACQVRSRRSFLCRAGRRRLAPPPPLPTPRGCLCCRRQLAPTDASCCAAPVAVAAWCRRRHHRHHRSLRRPPPPPHVSSPCRTGPRRRSRRRVVGPWLGPRSTRACQTAARRTAPRLCSPCRDAACAPRRTTCCSGVLIAIWYENCTDVRASIWALAASPALP